MTITNLKLEYMCLGDKEWYFDESKHALRLEQNEHPGNRVSL